MALTSEERKTVADGHSAGVEALLAMSALNCWSEGSIRKRGDCDETSLS